MSPATPPVPPTPRRRLLFQELTSPRDVLANLSPNWFASVMGTAIIATGAASLPDQGPALRVVELVAWAFSAVMLVLLTLATIGHWALWGESARSHHRNPVIAHFYGAPAMAFLTVGAGTLLVGKDWIGIGAALRVDWVVWIIGAALGMASAVVVPYLAFTQHENSAQSAFGGWLMPVVPPMLAGSTGSLLVPYAPIGQLRETLFWGCFALFGLGLLTSFLIIPLIWNRLVVHDVGPAGMVPTLWIVLGPMGQSITAANLLGGVAGHVLDDSTAHAVRLFGLVYGVPMLGLALGWTAICVLITIRTARTHLPFSLTWWSFTFPIGTCVTGFSALGAHTGVAGIAVLAVVFWVGLVAAWIVVAARTVHGSVIRGTLLAPAQR